MSSDRYIPSLRYLNPFNRRGAREKRFNESDNPAQVEAPFVRVGQLGDRNVAHVRLPRDMNCRTDHASLSWNAYNRVASLIPGGPKPGRQYVLACYQAGYGPGGSLHKEGGKMEKAYRGITSVLGWSHVILYVIMLDPNRQKNFVGWMWDFQEAEMKNFFQVRRSLYYEHSADYRYIGKTRWTPEQIYELVKDWMQRNRDYVLTSVNCEVFVQKISSVIRHNAT